MLKPGDVLTTDYHFEEAKSDHVGVEVRRQGSIVDCGHVDEFTEIAVYINGIPNSRSKSDFKVIRQKSRQLASNS